MGESLSGNRKIEVVHSPALFPIYFQNKDCIVVVIDIFRATSAICAAFHNGVKSIIPVATLEEAITYKEKGFLVGAERKGEIVEGFDFGNSPLKFKSGEFKDETIVLTTTNGTKAIQMAKEASKVVIGAFTNITAVSDFVMKENKDVLLLCAGWKDRFNIEDTLFSGAVAQNMLDKSDNLELSDSAIAAVAMYENTKDNIRQFLTTSSHSKRLSSLNLDADIDYCLIPDQTTIVPILQGDALISNK